MVNINKKIKVLIVDDSDLVRELIKEILYNDDDLIVVGEAKDGSEAIELTKKLSPNIIIMDIQMPIMDGFEATEHIMAFKPTPILIFSSALNKTETYSSIKAIGLGALDVLEKPDLSNIDTIKVTAKDFIRKIKFLSRIPVITHIKGRRKTDLNSNIVHDIVKKMPDKAEEDKAQLFDSSLNSSSSKEKADINNSFTTARYTSSFPTNIEVIAIGASTGGPVALKKVLSELPYFFPYPIVIVQHIADGFIEGLVEWLNSECKVKIKVAEENEVLENNYVYFAPTSKQMLINSNKRIELSSMLPPWNGHKPSVNYLFRSIGDSFGSKAIEILLTGMGNDGAEGMQHSKSKGTFTIAQDEKTSLIFGMPKSAIDIGVVDRILPLYEIPNFLLNLL